MVLSNLRICGGRARPTLSVKIEIREKYKVLHDFGGGGCNDSSECEGLDAREIYCREIVKYGCRDYPSTPVGNTWCNESESCYCDAQQCVSKRRFTLII